MTDANSIGIVAEYRGREKERKNEIRLPHGLISVYEIKNIISVR